MSKWGTKSYALKAGWSKALKENNNSPTKAYKFAVHAIFEALKKKKKTITKRRSNTKRGGGLRDKFDAAYDRNRQKFRDDEAKRSAGKRKN